MDKKIKKYLAVAGIVIIAAGLLGIGYYYYQTINYFSTQNASVSADMITLTPEITGQLLEWNVAAGDEVKAGQVLGRQDVSTLVSTSALNPASLANSADTLVAKADIRSPIDGKIILANVVRGQVLSPGMEIATVADTVHPYIKANIEETDIFHIQTGQAVDIKLDAYPRQKFIGYVGSIGLATNSALGTSLSLNTSGTYSKVTQLIPVRIIITNADDLVLMPGMNATVRIHIN
ncbi:MAG: efflux RND transporter periplasmic adaptor subunit [Syntrophomonadaceae bacterium]